MEWKRFCLALGTGAILGCLLPTTAVAGRANLTAAMEGRGPAVNASEIPALAKLLDKAGWTPTPELSGVFKAGSIFLDDGSGHSLMVRDCFGTPATSDTYTSMELVTQLQGGVRVRAGLVSARGSGSLVKRVKFGTPVHHTLERLAMNPTPECLEMLGRATAEALGQMYAVQEVLTAQIAEQTCGRIDAKGRFVGLGSAEMELSRACMQESLEPVAVAYRRVPVSELEVVGRAVVPAPARHLAETTAGCPWGPIQSVSTTMATLTVNGTTMDVRGQEARAGVMDTMHRCGRSEAARAFDNWRRWRRTTNITGATLVGFYPFGIGMLASVQAGKWRPYMERVLMDPGEVLPIEGLVMPGEKKLRRMTEAAPQR